MIIDTVHFGADTLNNFTETIPVIKKTFLDSVAIQQNARFVTHGIVLKTVNIKERKLTPTELVVKSHVHRLELDDGASTLDLVNTPTIQGVSIIDYIQGKFPGLQITIDPLLGITFKYRGKFNFNSQASPPFFYVDEARSSLEDVESIPTPGCCTDPVCPTACLVCSRGRRFNGAILVYTKIYGDDRGNNSKRSFDRYTFNGYSVTREFPLPDYSDLKQKQATDYRTTLYWNHDVDMDDNGNFKISFYNSDKTKKYRVVVQGMDVDGRVGYLSEEF